MKPTRLNVWVMVRHFGGADFASAAVERVDYRHMSRCLRAGYFRVNVRTLELTDAGRAAIHEWQLANPTPPARLWDGEGEFEDCEVSL